MKIIRNNFAEAYTEGVWTSDFIEDDIFTLEQEWRPDKTHLGGTNDNSCVPNGTYTLRGFRRPKNGILVPMLYNKDLGVYRSKIELPPEGGRFLILIHPGNRVEDVVGCICCGLWKQGPGHVGSSRDAQALIVQAFNEGDKELEIVSFDTKEIYQEPDANLVNHIVHCPSIKTGRVEDCTCGAIKQDTK